MITARRLGSAMVAAALLSVLSGCDQFPSDDVALQIAGGRLVVTVCEQLEGSEMSMQERAGSDWSLFFKSWERFSLSAGDQIIVGGDGSSDLAPSIDRLPELTDGDDISMLLGASGDDQLRASFTVPRGGMPSEGWLRPDGSVATEPCPS